jgi:superfamily II DNA or RNA helicase
LSSKGESLSVADLALWPHQVAAIADAEAYFASGSARGCLVQMPTGTGKTGVMAVVASRRCGEAPVLVVCPSAALVEQLTDQLSSGFWEKIEADPGWRPDYVWHVLPSEVANLSDRLDAERGRRIVLVGTVQAVQQIEAAGRVGLLQGRVGTILFDEGHREPAPLWAKVVRGFAVPTVLFSATPFRGDLKVFDVDDDHIHFLSFQAAVDERLIRGVEITEEHLPQDVVGFATDLVARVDALTAEGRLDAGSKVIVRCASEEAVADMHRALNAALGQRPDGVIAIHHNFSAKMKSGMTGSVPARLAERGERFLVHQFMLIEGIDDPACTMLALYEPFENTRMLVQQVGRLIRHPGPIGAEAGKALVLAPSGHGVATEWDNFLLHDSASIENGGKPYIRNDNRILGDLIAALPTLDYVAGKFRRRVDLDADELATDLRFPSAAVAFSVGADLDMDRFAEEVRSLLEKEDRHLAFEGETAGGACRYHLTLRLTPSPFLNSFLFQAPGLEATIYTKVGSRLFFYDSVGLQIDEVTGVGARVGPKGLGALLSEGPNNDISFINLKNTDLGPLSLRSRSLSARSLERSGVFVGEHMNVVTRASGLVELPGGAAIRRAVGFSRSRVRDGRGTELTASEFAEWCAAIGAELDAAAAAAPLFGRFALPTDPPADTTPINILIDMLEVSGGFESKGKAANVDAEDLCVSVTPDPDQDAPAPFKFVLKVDGTDHNVWIDWDRRKKKYWLVSPGLSEIKSMENEKVSLTRRLNQLQPFRIITAGLDSTYVNGSFYKVDFELSKTDGPARLVLDLVTAVPGMEKITSEKGVLTAGLQAGWGAGSLFAFLDRALRPDLGPAIMAPAFPNLVCDDLQDEVGDFIGLDDRPASQRATLVVAKWKGGNPGVSASAFYDVCAQGVKNLPFMKTDGRELPGSSTRFDGRWQLSNKGRTVTQQVERRRHGVTSRAFRKAFQRLRSSPTTERSIWLVCAGGMLSAAKLRKEFAKQQPEPHVLQFYHLVMSTYSACQSVGVQLRIFCSP